jgi:predicted nucleotidyltransferase
VDAVTALQRYFTKEADVAAVYLYGSYATPTTYPDSDLELAILFQDRLSEDETAQFLEHMQSTNPLGEAPGILMPSALNTHILPVIYEMLSAATVIVDNDPAARADFASRTMAQLDTERPALLDEAKEAITQARTLGLIVVPSDGVMLPQPPRLLDPLRIGWRLARILASAAVLDSLARSGDSTERDPELLGQLVGWFSNAVGAATGIAKAMLTMFEMPRPPRRWQVFIPLADAGLVPMELALQMAANVESRWQLVTGSGMMSPERLVAVIRASLMPVIGFARLAAWYTQVPGAKADHHLH